MIWKRYIDDAFEMVRKEQRDVLIYHLSSMDPTGCIKSMDEPETEGMIPFLDALISCKENESMKIKVYHKKTYTDWYLHFSSHHSLTT